MGCQIWIMIIAVSRAVEDVWELKEIMTGHNLEEKQKMVIHT